MTLPALATRASKYFGFDSDGASVELDAPANTTAASTFGATLIVSANAGAARSILGSATIGDALFLDETAANARTTLGLGDAALKTVGVANGNVPAMDATGYPAADGSQITNITLAYDDTVDATGKILQIVQLQDGAVATGTTVVINDDSIPQNDEGDEYMTLAITPKSASSRLKIEVVWNGATSAGSDRILIVALFRDAIADALATGSLSVPSADMLFVSFNHDMASPGTSEITLKVRAGFVGAGTTTFNGTAGARKFGGVMASSIIITEYVP